MNNNDFLKKINKDEINRIYNKKNTHTFLLDDNLSDFELCSQLDRLSKTSKNKGENIKKKYIEKINLPTKNKSNDNNYYYINFRLNNKKCIKTKNIEKYYTKFYKFKDNIKEILINKNIIKSNDVIPYKLLFQLYINYISNDLKLI